MAPGPLVPRLAGARYNCPMTSHTIMLHPSGIVFEARADASILEAAEAAGIALPSSCRNGSCRTCICRVRSGAAAHRIAWPGLSFDEKREGYILPCVALARGDLVLEAPTVRRVAPD